MTLLNFLGEKNSASQFTKTVVNAFTTSHCLFNCYQGKEKRGNSKENENFASVASNVLYHFGLKCDYAFEKTDTCKLGPPRLHKMRILEGGGSGE